MVLFPKEGVGWRGRYVKARGAMSKHKARGRRNARARPGREKPEEAPNLLANNRNPAQQKRVTKRLRTTPVSM
jgi:hypothetical protein